MGDVIEQTRSPMEAATETVSIYTDRSNTSDSVLNADLSPFLPEITETIVPPLDTEPLMLSQATLSPANTRGVVEDACVDLGGGGGGTDRPSNSPSFVSALCVLGRDALLLLSFGKGTI